MERPCNVCWARCAGGERPAPKAIARELYDLGFDFNNYITHHGTALGP